MMSHTSLRVDSSKEPVPETWARTFAPRTEMQSTGDRAMAALGGITVEVRHRHSAFATMQPHQGLQGLVALVSGDGSKPTNGPGIPLSTSASALYEGPASSDQSLRCPAKLEVPCLVVAWFRLGWLY